ncbi:MAG: hypothetical protein HY236_07310 [Acidobacteria bacterium]|nr:hypothetical protein [Acidobacteriota bacterium]
MSEQGWLFIFCILMVLLSLGVAAWLVVTGRVVNMDGLFLILVCGVVALMSALQMKFMLKG